MSMDVSSVHEHCQSDRSLSPKQPASELGDKSGSGNVSSKPATQELDTVKNMQIDSAEDRIVQSCSEIAENLSLSNHLTSDSNYGSPTPPKLEQAMEQKQDIDAEDTLAECGIQESNLLKNEPKAFCADMTRNSPTKQVGPPLEDLKVKSTLEHMGLHQCTITKSTLEHLEPQTLGQSENPVIEQLELNVKDTIENASPAGPGGKETPLPLGKCEDLSLPTEKEERNSTLGHLGSPHCDESKHHSAELLEQSERAAIENPCQSNLGDKGNPIRSRKRRKSTSGPQVTSIRVLRARSQEKPKNPELNNIAADVTDDGVRKRERRKKKQMKKNSKNEFSRIRSHLRYLLHRIKYEQNLIDAYSAEGWKGQSLEKIKPEKELQQAKSHILCYKLKIRDLFQRLDLSLAEGRFPESLYDSEGEIDSEDIFCAKCGSKDLPDDNDIILCDGACERGFHQFCLEPPLLKEEIPADDEGWLCPGCDCKVDCIDVLNDFHGRNLSVLDSWEKVFPEAAAAVSGKTLYDSSGFSSDDSKDDDYDPDKPELDEKVQGDETSSDESDYFSASDGLVDSPNSKRYLGLASEDSEDDDYDPTAPDHDVHIKQECSSSDFTSDSEDLGAIFDENTSLDEDRGRTSLDGGSLEVGRVKKQSLRDELSYLLDSNVAPVLGKRHVERLDYKKLYDETYENVSTDSSDEDYEETAGQKRRKNNSGKIAPTSPRNSPVVDNGGDVKPENHNQKQSEHTPKRTRKKLDVEGTSNSSTSHRSSREEGSSVKSTARPYKKLREEITQRLLRSFKENQYPKRPEKESLAKELGLTIQQVSKWFENARWSYRHSASMESDATAGASREHSSSLQLSGKPA